MISKPNKSKLSTEGDVYRYYNLNKKEIQFTRNILKKEPSPEENIAKIQAVTRGHQQRNKTKKIKAGIVKLQAVTRGHQQRKKSKKQNSKKGGKNKTLKKYNFKFW